MSNTTKKNMFGCSTCSTFATIEGSIKGCKSNGNCSSGGCTKRNTFDWLSNMDLPIEDKFDVAEIRFKNGRKEFFRNANKLDLYLGDPVVVDVPNGHHIGYVALQGELVRLQMRKKNVRNDEQLRLIYRLASSSDLEKFMTVQSKENATMYRSRAIIKELNLSMKLSDVEFQADNAKAVFYYSAETRVDFRELIKLLANEFKVRIEMRQISLRQEAGRLGGIGSCGRELCCSTWLSEFKSTSNSAARYQSLSLNPNKLAGQCGRLKCCLNYELDTYKDALQYIPVVETELTTKKGGASLQKTDIFRKIMWFSYKIGDAWVALSIQRVNEVLAMNIKGEIPDTLLENKIQEERKKSTSLNSDLAQMDKKFSNPKKPSSKKKRLGNKFRHKKINDDV